MSTHDIWLSQSQSQSRRVPRWLWIVLGVVLVAVILGLGIGLMVGGADPGPPVSGVTSVAVNDNAFAPAAIEVPVGTTVTWQWAGQNQHNVVGAGFESPVQQSGAFDYTFDEPGTFDYECTLHFGMRGRVLVTEETA